MVCIDLNHITKFCWLGSSSKPPGELKGGILPKNHQNSQRKCRYMLGKAEWHQRSHMPKQTNGIHVCNGLWLVTTYIVFHVAKYIMSDSLTYMLVWNFHDLLQVKLDLSCLQDIKDDMDFCCRLAKEESVVVLPGALLFSWIYTWLILLKL